MKLKNKLLFFLGIFIFMIIPKNVYAKEIYPYAIGMNNTNFTDASTSYNADVSSGALPPDSTFTLMIGIESYNYRSPTSASLDLNYSFADYPYTLIYFQSWKGINDFTITKNTSCSQSCFNNNNVSIKQIGTDAISGRNKYILVFQNMKWYASNTPTGGSGTWVYHIDDQITFNSLAGYGGFIFYQVLLTDDANIMNNNSVDINTMLENANNNRLQIVNAVNDVKSNINSAFNALKGNDNTNTQSIINNQNSNQQQTNQKLDNLNNTLNSEDAPTNNDVSNKTQEWTNKLAGTGPVSNMVLMPITLLNGYVSGMNASCSPFNLGTLYNTQLTLPCINVSNYLGSSLWSIIDVLFSGFMIYAIGKKFVKIFNDFTNLRDNQMDELYGGGK